MPDDRLPIEEVLESICDAVARDNGAVVEAPPGAGKTTRVPVALARHFERSGGHGQVVVVEPRRLAARSAANRVARELGVELGGQKVGYRVRFDNRAGRDTAIVFVTAGVLLRWLSADVALDGVRCLVFDEFHERGLDSDLALALCQHLRRELREDLALVVMSATLDGERIAHHLELPRVVSSGRLYPVEVEYQQRPDQRPLVQRMASCLQRRIGSAEVGEGAILAFLPGVGEIRRVRERIEETARASGWTVTELYGAQRLDQQQRALQGPRKRVVLSTNVAESSVTVEGVTTVVDSGLHKVLRFDPSRGVDRLVTEPIPLTSSEQRRGRAGRQESGTCIRLWTRAEDSLRRSQPDAEVDRVDLAGAALQVASIGVGLGDLPWVDAPSVGRVAAATTELERMGALAEGQVTAMGRRMGELPVVPRLARLLIAGERHGVLQEVCWTAALLSERDPMRSSSGGELDRAALPSDLEERFEILRRRARRRERGGRWSTIERVADQLQRIMSRRTAVDEAVQGDEGAGSDALGAALAEALPDRVALARIDGSWRARMVGGLGVLPGRSRVRDEGLLVVLDLDLTGSSGRLALAHQVTVDDLPTARCRRTIEVEWNSVAEQAEAFEVDWFEDLELRRHRLAPHGADAETSERLSGVLSANARENPVRALGLDRPEIANFLQRARLLRRLDPALDVSPPEELIDQLVDSLCAGSWAFEQLRAQPIFEMLLGSWTHRQTSRLDEWLPQRIQVPGGRWVPIDYRDDGPPILAARIQELFGWSEAPVLAGGRLKLLLHLLAPNRRPAQITDDLHGFWRGSYRDVRKELAGRYPKHRWPENPLELAE